MRGIIIPTPLASNFIEGSQCSVKDYGECGWRLGGYASSWNTLVGMAQTA